MADSPNSAPATRFHHHPNPITTKVALDRACRRFEVATCLITEGDRPGAAHQLRAAIKTLDGHRGAADLRADLEQLLAGVILRRTA
mgnify:CR=1 FL=1